MQVRVQTAEETYLLGQAQFWAFIFYQETDICAPSLQEESLPGESALTTETQDRASIPGLLIEANRSQKELALIRDNYNN